MLILTRKEQDVVRIGDDIRVTVVSVRGKSVRLGFESPRGIPIHRDEVYQAIHRGEKQSAKP